MADWIGQRLGNYRLVRLLGEGGYAQVYLGEQVLLGMQAAIKVLHAHLTEREIKRFCQEASAIAHLVHPHIVRVLEFDVDGGVPYLVMEYAPGGTLRQRHPEGVPLTLPTIQRYLTQLAEALAYAHAHHILHRDVKPANVLVGEQGQILLSDFGLALLAERSSQLPLQEVVGTPAYLAPEQVQGHPRRASDQYALGIMVYEWLTGKRPFTGTFMEVVVQQSVAPPRSLRDQVPSIETAVEKVVLRALAKDPKERFPSIEAFASAFRDACQNETRPTSVSRHTNPQPNPSKASPHPPVAQPHFEWLEGRRYLVATPYALPKDPQEVQRLDFQHFMIQRELHGNYLAPLSQPTSILDVGCGTGRWAMEMATEFPSAKVVEIDLVLPDSPASLGHGLAQQPENVAFLKGDILTGLPFASASFDFVYIRLLFAAVPERNWPALLDELIRVTKPEGWIESVESWTTMSEPFSSGYTFTQWVNEWLRQRELDPLIARKMPEMMRAKGLEQIVTHEVKHTPPDSQRWKQIYSTIGLAALENLRTPILAQGIVTAEEYDLVAATMRQEIQNGKTYMWPVYVTFGQRRLTRQ
jgi:serine/threonine protein kinase